MSECGTYSCLGSRCVKPVGHTDHHRSAHGVKWTDESNRLAADAISKSMQGKRD